MQRWKALLLNSFAEEAITEHYSFIKTLGHGSFGDVKLARHRRTQTTVVVKMQPKGERNARIQLEVDIMKGLDHPNIIRLLQVVESTRYTYIVLEHAAGGELKSRVEQLGHLEEKESRRVFKQLVYALHYCHSKRIVHRDVKPENILLDGDFGLSTKVDIGQKVTTFCGTLEYCAPEIFKGKAYDAYAADIWSLGVVLYFMSTGRHAFPGYTYDTIKNRVLAGKYDIQFQLSPELWEVISKLLNLEPGQRPTTGDIVGLAWLKYGDGSSLELSREDMDSHLDLTVRASMDVMGYSPHEIRAPSREADGSLKHAERPSIRKASSVPSMKPEVDVGRRHSMPPRPCLKKSTQAESNTGSRTTPHDMSRSSLSWSWMFSKSACLKHAERPSIKKASSVPGMKPEVDVGRRHSMPPRPCLKKSTQAESNTGSRTTPHDTSRSSLSWSWMFSKSACLKHAERSSIKKASSVPGMKPEVDVGRRHSMPPRPCLKKSTQAESNMGSRTTPHDTSRSSLSWSWMFSKSEDVATADSDKSKNSKSPQDMTPHLSREESYCVDTSTEGSSTTETPQEHLSEQPREVTTAVRPNSKNSASSWHRLHLLTREDSLCENISPQSRESRSWPTGTSKKRVRRQPWDVSTSSSPEEFLLITRDEVDTENINAAGRDSGTLPPQSSAQQLRSPQGATVPRAPLWRRIWKGLKVRAANCLRTLCCCCCCCMPAHRRQHPGRNKMPVGNEDHGDSSENNHVEATDLPGP